MRLAWASAWDLKGDQTFVLRGGAGLFFDRPPVNTTYSTVLNPPFTRNVTVRFGSLANMSGTGLATEAPPALTVFEYDQPLPSSVQWNGGVQLAIPFSTVLDVAYTGQHSYNALQSSNINSIDLGMAFLPEFQNPVTSNPANPDRSRHLVRVDESGDRPVLSGLRHDQPAAAGGVAHLPLHPVSL